MINFLFELVVASGSSESQLGRSALLHIMSGVSWSSLGWARPTLRPSHESHGAICRIEVF